MTSGEQTTSGISSYFPRRSKLVLSVQKPNESDTFSPGDNIVGCVSLACESKDMPERLKLKLVGTCTRLGVRDAMRPAVTSEKELDNEQASGNVLSEKETFQETVVFLRTVEIVEPHTSEKPTEDELAAPPGFSHQVWKFSLALPEYLDETQLDEWKNWGLPPSLNVPNSPISIAYRITASPYKAPKILHLINKISSDSRDIKVGSEIEEKFSIRKLEQAKTKVSVPVYDERALTWKGWAKMLAGFDIAASRTHFVITANVGRRGLNPGEYLQGAIGIYVSQVAESEKVRCPGSQEFEIRCKRIELNTSVKTRAQVHSRATSNTSLSLYRAGSDNVDDGIPLDSPDTPTDVSCLLSGISLPSVIPPSVQLPGFSIVHTLQCDFVLRPIDRLPYRKDTSCRISQVIPILSI